VSGRALGVAAVGAAGLAALGLLGVVLSDGPYVSWGELNAWLVVWAVALFALLGLAPFALHRRMAERTTDHDRRWELAILAWGALALAGVLCFGAVAGGEGFGTGSAAGAIAVVGLAECALVVGAVALLMLTTG
jgi:hypothetical protein